MDSSLNRAALRHEISNWRDHQIIEASAAINRVAAACRTDVQADFAVVRVADSLFNADTFAGERVDEWMAEPLSSALADRLAEAAKDLAAIDASLVEIAAMLPDRAADFGAPPAHCTAPPTVEDANATVISADGTLVDEERSLTRRFTRGASQMVGAAAGLASAAASATESVIRERLDLKARLTAAATRRIGDAYLGDNPDSVRSRMIKVIDDVSEAARLMLA